MKFFEHLLGDLKNYSVYQKAEQGFVEQNNAYTQNFLKKPDKSVAILKPKNFDDVLKLVRFISGNRSAVIDFNGLDGAVLMRSVDFVSGAVCALSGNIQNISNGIYLFAPTGTKLMTNKRKKQKQ